VLHTEEKYADPRLLIDGIKTRKNMEHKTESRKHKHCREISSRILMEI
jgi:hypothetical protein